MILVYQHSIAIMTDDLLFNESLSNNSRKNRSKITGEYIGHPKSIIDISSNKSLLKSLFRHFSLI